MPNIYTGNIATGAGDQFEEIDVSALSIGRFEFLWTATSPVSTSMGDLALYWFTSDTAGLTLAQARQAQANIFQIPYPREDMTRRVFSDEFAIVANNLYVWFDVPAALNGKGVQLDLNARA